MADFNDKNREDSNDIADWMKTPTGGMITFLFVVALFGYFIWNFFTGAL